MSADPTATYSVSATFAPNGREPDAHVILARVDARRVPACRRSEPTPARPSTSRAGRSPARRRPRHVPAPEDDRRHRRVGAVGETEHRDDAQVRRVGRSSTARRSIPVHPTYETVLGHRCYTSLVDVPGDLDLAIILTGRAVDTFEEVLQRKAKFAVIFAAGFSETGAEGEKLEAPPRRSSCAAATCACSGRTRTSTRSRSSATTSKARRSRSITQSGHQGRPVFQGQEIGIRLTHWAPTGNEVDLEFADFARYFADQPEVGVIACYIEGFKDGRTLMLAADHAAQLRKPIVMVKVGKTAAGQSMAAVAHRSPHRFRRGDERGVPPVRRDARRRSRRAARSVGRARSHPAGRVHRRGRRPAAATGRLRLRDLGRHGRAHGRRRSPPRGCASPTSRRSRSRRCTTG